MRHFPARTGLLNDVDSDYYVTPSPETRRPYSDVTIEDEIDRRFGAGTLPAHPARSMTMPPRGLFDDV